MNAHDAGNHIHKSVRARKSYLSETRHSMFPRIFLSGSWLSLGGVVSLYLE